MENSTIELTIKIKKIIMGKLLNWNFKKNKRYEDYCINKTDVLCRDCKYMEFKNSFDIIQCKNNFPCLNHNKFKSK